MSEPDAHRLYRRWLHELWPSGDLALAQALVTPDFVGHWPGQDVTGPAGLVDMINQSLALFSEVTTDIEVGPVAEGELVAARWRFHGSYAGGMPAVTAAAGTPATLRGADLLRLDGDRFAEYWVSSDAEQLVAQLNGG